MYGSLIITFIAVIAGFLTALQTNYMNLAPIWTLMLNMGVFTIIMLMFARSSDISGARRAVFLLSSLFGTATVMFLHEHFRPLPLMDEGAYLLALVIALTVELLAVRSLSK